MAAKDHVQLAKAVSRLFGWIYTLAWSLSFYPQPLLNFRRKSTIGSTIDFPGLNTIGFFFYSISQVFMYFSDIIHKQYAARNPVSPVIAVQLNDVVFSIHAFIMCIITVSMFSSKIWGFSQGKNARMSRPIAGIAVGVIISVIVVLFRVIGSPGGGFNAREWAWIDLVYAFGYAKLVITFVKYMPQVYLNYQRKSTKGWSIQQILCDFTGGVLSVAQLVIDSSLQNDWSGITGNPVKFLLGNVSCFFDIIFMVQHFILYRQPPEDETAKLRRDEEEGLLERQSSHED